MSLYFYGNTDFYKSHFIWKIGFINLANLTQLIFEVMLFLFKLDRCTTE